MASFKEMPRVQLIDYKYSKLLEDFIFSSDYISYECVIPAGFIMDWESIPLIRGTSKISGLIHDYLCRKDSIPIVTKKIAADVYLEFLKYRNTSYIRRYGKYWTVRCAQGYFHKMAVLDEILIQKLSKGNDNDNF